MPKYYVNYRNEFDALVEAKDEEEAKRKFSDGEATINVVGNGLWDEYFEVNKEEGL